MPYRSSITHALNSFCIKDRPYLPRSVATTVSSHPYYNSLSMHINMHYIPSTTDPTAFYNPPKPGGIKVTSIVRSHCE